jgi:formate-dependent nitrite reductase cytochrome c552 subunit
MCRHLFAVLRSIGGRRIERKFDQLAIRMETMMTQTKNELLDEIKAVKEAVQAHVQGRAEEIDAAIAKAKAAWDADNQEEHDAAMVELETIRKSVAQPPFSPSGN